MKAKAKDHCLHLEGTGTSTASVAPGTAGTHQLPQAVPGADKGAPPLTQQLKSQFYSDKHGGRPPPHPTSGQAAHCPGSGQEAFVPSLESPKGGFTQDHPLGPGPEKGRQACCSQAPPGAAPKLQLGGDTEVAVQSGLGGEMAITVPSCKSLGWERNRRSVGKSAPRPAPLSEPHRPPPRTPRRISG